MPTHPLERLPVRTLRAATIAQFAAWILLTLVIGFSVPPDVLSRVARLAAAGSAANASVLLADWPSEARQAASYSR